jgi:hypothetical protein
MALNCDRILFTSGNNAAITWSIAMNKAYSRIQRRQAIKALAVDIAAGAAFCFLFFTILFSL